MYVYMLAEDSEPRIHARSNHVLMLFCIEEETTSLHGVLCMEFMPWKYYLALKRARHRSGLLVFHTVAGP